MSQIPSGSPAISDRQTIRSLQVLRFVAAAIVIATHASKSLTNYARNIGNDDAVQALAWLQRGGDAGVDIFFVLSGFIMVYITGEKFQRPGFSQTFLLRRIVRVYPIYWFFSLPAIAVLVVKLWLSKSMYVGDTLDFDVGWITKSFLLIPLEKPDGSMGPVLSPGWTLIFEVYFYFVFALFCMQKKLPPAAIVGVCFVGLVSLGIWFPSDNVYWEVYSHPLLLEFAAGCALGYLYLRKKFSSKWFVFLPVVGFAALWTLGDSSLPNGKMTDSRVFTFGIPSVLIVTGFLGMEASFGKGWPRWMVSLGDSSYSAYLSHTAITLKAGAFVVMKANLLERLGSTPCALSLVVLAILVGHVSYLWIEKPLVSWSKRLMFPKPSKTPLPATP